MKMEWIRTSIQKPKDFQLVLGYFPCDKFYEELKDYKKITGSKCIEIVFYNSNIDSWENFIGFFNNSPEYWMELPDEPVEAFVNF